MAMEKARVKAFGNRRKYQSVKPCKKHGEVERYTNSGTCILCQKEASSRRAEEVRKALEYLRHLDNVKVAR